MTNNQTVLDLNKVQHATFGYRNNFGHWRRLKPKATFLNHDVSHALQPELMSKLDIWKPVVRFQLTANHTIQYTGKKAVALWKAWCEKIFKK